MPIEIIGIHILNILWRNVMSDSKNTLEWYIAEKLQEIDKTARPTKASGASHEIGDISSKLFWCECKQKNSKNVIMEREEDWIKLAKRIPVHNLKEMFVAIENRFGERFIVMETEAFFRILKLAYGEEDNDEN